ncbi:MAG: hypothetical protein WBQ89_20580 [Candidatus Acidiferrum sp.]
METLKQENGTGANMMACTTTMLAYLSGGLDQETTTYLNLDTHGHLLSLLQSNVSPGQFGMSQTDDYLARRNQTSTRSIVMNVQMMTSILVFSNIDRNLRIDVVPDKGRVSGGMLAVSLFHTRRSIKLIYCKRRAPRLSMIAQKNQTRINCLEFDTLRQSGRVRPE